jgi:hypothetical protein
MCCAVSESCAAPRILIETRLALFCSWSPIPFFLRRRALRSGRANKANAGALTIRELNAGSLEGVLQSFHSPLLELISSLKSRNGIDRNLRRGRKFANTQAESRACHPTLHWKKKNHDVVLISVAGLDFFGILTVN